MLVNLSVYRYRSIVHNGSESTSNSTQNQFRMTNGDGSFPRAVSFGIIKPIQLTSSFQVISATPSNVYISSTSVAPSSSPSLMPLTLADIKDQV